jgi:hypothetical protein
MASAVAPSTVDPLKSIPMSLACTLLVFIFLAAYYGLSMPAFGSSSFLGTQMMVNFLMSVIISVVYGVICLFLPETHALNKFQNAILPIFLIGFLWFKAYFTYAGNLKQYCIRNASSDIDQSQMQTPYRPKVLIWNTSKIAIAAFIVYIFISMCSWTLTPFFEMFGSAHPLVFFFAVGFWIGCSTWAAETSCFFAIQKDGCIPLEKVSFADIDSKIKALPDPLNGKT